MTAPPAFAPSPEQAAVIDAPLASMRVSAGAGTGKTATIAHRVVRLVADGVDPEEILGITFTNKAAEELTERIRSALAGVVEPSREVEVHTYHGFAAALLREYGPLVGVERGTDVVTPAFARQILAEVVHRVPVTSFDPTVPSAVETLRRLASSLSDNLLDPASVPIPEHPDDVWRKRAEMLRIVEEYEAAKRRLGVADYGDLIRKAHLLATTRPEVADQVAGRYRAVLLDEYQDTDPAQRELLRAVFSGRAPVLAVGDEDQTIYEWRGASLRNFRDFPRHFPVAGAPAPTHHLTANRRSGPAILAVANAVRARIDSAPRPALVPLDDAPTGLVTTGWFGTSVVEAEWIANRILALHETGRRWRDVGILFRKNRHMLLVHDALARHDVPFEVANLGGLLSVPEVADLHAWLRVLGRPEDGPALARLLLGARFRLGLGDLAALTRWVRHRRGEQETPGEHDAAMPDFTLVEAIERLDEVEELRPEARRALEQFRREHAPLLVAAQGLSLVELCRAILDRTGAWSDIAAMDAAAGLSARLNLYRLLDLAEDWSPLEGRPSLEAFLDHLDALSEDGAEELDTARISDSDAVTLITVHRAKGLEWPVVFVPTAYEGNFPARGGLDNPLRTAEVLPYELRLDRDSLPSLEDLAPKDQDAHLRARRDSQEWRIAYVAVTRAREELHVTGAYWYGRPQPTRRAAKPSELFALVEASDASRAAVPTPEAPPRPEVVGLRSERDPAPDPLLPWPEALRRASSDPDWPRRHAGEMGIVESYDAAVAEYQQMLFRLPDPPAPSSPAGVDISATGLVTYAVCPRRYYWSDVDRLPRRVTTAARRGVDVHRRIELHHLGVMSLDEAAGADAALDMSETDGDVERARPDPYAVFARSRFASERPILVEAPFTLRLGERVRVRGRIDAVYERPAGGEERHWEVVDFKSGRARGGDAELVQLQTYALAVEAGPFGRPPPESFSVTFAYLGGDRLEERSARADDDWLAASLRRLSDLADGVESGSWEPTPSSACHRCDFLRFCPAGRAQVG